MKIPQLLGEEPSKKILIAALKQLPYAPPGLGPRYTEKDDDDRYSMYQHNVEAKHYALVAKKLLALTPVKIRDLEKSDFKFDDFCTLIINLDKYEILALTELFDFIRPGSFYLYQLGSM